MIVQSQHFLKTNGPINNFYKFEGYTLGGQDSSNGFKVFNGCIVEPNELGGPILPPPPKKKLKNLLFSEKCCDWTIFFQVSRFECPHYNVMAMTKTFIHCTLMMMLLLLLIMMTMLMVIVMVMLLIL